MRAGLLPQRRDRGASLTSAKPALVKRYFWRPWRRRDVPDPADRMNP